MIATSKCPDGRELQRFLLGEPTAQAADVLEGHIEQCQRCSQLLPRLAADDTLVAAMRARAKSRLPQPEKVLLDGLMARLQKTLPPALVDTMSGENTVAPLQADASRELCSFLAPAHGPDELGRLGTFRILKVLGKGGMGIVLQAEDTQLKRSVAVKAMLAEVAKKATARERFLREARAAAALEHDHIVAIYHVGEEAGVPYLVMPLLKGASLEGFLQKKQGKGGPGASATGALTVGQILKLGREIAKGLSAAHAVGLIHRDIKPANIWLDATAGGRVKVLDFGLARAVTDDAQLTSPGLIVGTPSYMAPEQGQGKPVDGRADLFSLGCVLYRLCAGRLPFQGSDAISTLVLAATEDPTPLEQLQPELPPALCDLVRRLMAKNPLDRPPSAEAVVEVIAQIERDLGAPCPRAVEDKTRTLLPPPPIRPRCWQWTAVAAALVAVGGVVVAQVIVRITDKEGKVQEIPVPAGSKVEIVSRDTPGVKLPSGDEAWTRRVAALPASEQVEAVAARLKERNPDFSGKVADYKIENGVVTQFKVWSNHLRDLSPVRALTGLRVLHCVGNWGRDGKSSGILEDLSPLKGLPLTELNLHNNKQLARLEPLKDMPLTALTISHTHVADLTPLQDLKLTKLVLYKSYVYNLRPLRAMPLEHLNIEGTGVKDVSPLSDLPVRTLLMGKTQVSDFTVLQQLSLRTFRGDLKPERDLRLLRSLWTLEQINDQSAVDFWTAHDPNHAAMLRWIDATRFLPSEKRLEAVRVKMMERNPEFDGTMTPTVRDGEVAELRFNTDHVVDIAPLRTFPWLKTLSCNGSRWKGKLADLFPLQGLPVEHLECVDNPSLRDLTALRHLPLTYLSCRQTNVPDLSPLHGLNLRRFECYYCANVRDLAPLEGMPLRELNISGTRATDLAPLRGMPLEKLSFKQTRVKDLTPLEGLPLRWLECTLMTPPNFAPLRNTPVREIICDRPEKQTASLSLLWALEKINGASALAFYQEHNPAHAAFLQWIADTRQLPAEKQVEQVKAKLKESNPDLDVRHVDAKIVNQQVVTLSLPAAEVTDLAPVRALPELRLLNCSGTPTQPGKLSDLSPLAGLPRLDKLYISRTAVADLAPLRGLRLAFLHCHATAVQDLSPVRHMALQEIGCDLEVARRGRTVLEAIKTLQTINNKSAPVFWKELTAKSP